MRPTKIIIEDILNANGVPAMGHQNFLNPTYDMISDTSGQFPHMNIATQRVHEAIKKGERIIVWGDFDVDGLTATSIMIRTLQFLGAKPEWYVPDRRVEGHGMSRDKVKKECSNRDLLITVDCGIQNYQEIKYAQHLGCDVIVTDHHTPRDRIPDAEAILHTHDEMNTRFSGAGIAFKFAQALLKDTNPEAAESLLWLAMLGTVVDCVPQLHENRVISALGLKQINENTPACIRALAIESEMVRPINKSQISWKLAPLLNSASRLSMAQVAQNILLAREEDTQKILALASELGSINTERKEVLDKFYQLGLQKADEQFESKHAGGTIVVVFDIEKDGDARGIQGILAARLAEEHLNMPTFVFTDIGDGVLVGSARTPKHKFSMLLDSVEHLIIGGGGHSTVGGLSLFTENLPEFVEMLDDNYFSAQYPQEELNTGVPLTVSEIGMDLYKALEVLEPYGDGSSPLFEIKCFLTGKHSIMGQEQNHIKFEIQDTATEATCQVLAWKKAADMEDSFRTEQGKNAEYTICGRLKLNDWGGETNIEIEAAEIIREEEHEHELYL